MGLPNFSADVSSEGVAFWLLLFLLAANQEGTHPGSGDRCPPTFDPNH